KSSHLKNF
ncbi:hypothetical protein D039_4328B, partial [Vibrio parahaemolyticus EKP-028]